jgi:predicted nucleic acid-binding protein
LLNEPLKAVLDSSIVIQTVVKEKYTDITIKLVSMLKEIYVPSLILYEIVNALVILTL